MNAVEYITGIGMTAVLVTALWVAASSLRARLLPGWAGAPAVIAGIVVAVSLAVVISEALGVVGLLNAPALIVVALCLAVALRPGSSAPVEGPPLAASVSGRVAFALAVAVALITAVHWAGPVLHYLDVGIYRQDSTWYHLPFAAWFAQTGSVDGLLLTDPLKLAVWYYPLNAELLHADGMVLLGNDLLSPLLNFGWMAVGLLAAWCVGRPFGLAAATLLGFALVAGSDMMLVQAGNAPSDIAALVFLTAAVAILVNGWAVRRTADSKQDSAHDQSGEALPGIDPGPLAIGALAAGLAVGTKVTMLIPVGAIGLGLLVIGRGRLRRHAVVMLGCLFATGGFWYLRNAFHAGNPLPWLTFGPLTGPDQAELYPRPAHSIAEYITDRHAWAEYFLPGFGETLGPLWFMVLFAAIAGIALGMRRQHDAPIRVFAFAAAAVLIAHVFNPISASGPEGGPYGFASNLRYAAPGIAIGLMLLPLCESRWMAHRVVMPAYALMAVAAALGSKEWVELELLAVALAAVVVLIPIWLIGQRSPGRRWVAIGAIAALAAVALFPQQQQYFHHRYRADVAPPLDNPGFRATHQWRQIQSWAREQHGMRIGIVGTPAAYGQYVFYGDDLSNEVRYVGEPRRYGALIPVASCRRWRKLIDDGRYDAIVITPEDPGSPLPPPQIAWTLDRTAIPVMRVLPAAVFLLTGRLQADRCPTGERPSGFPPFWPQGQNLPPGWLPQGLGRSGAGLQPPDQVSW